MGEGSSLDGTPFAGGWIEIFHSMPTWSRCFIVFRKRGGKWCSNASYELKDAADVKPGFRVFRIKTNELEFYLTNGSSRNWENNEGKNFVISSPGRYVLGYQSISRMGDADYVQCVKTLRATDRFIEVYYEASSEWLGSSIIYSKDEEDWISEPGIPMSRVRSTGSQLFLFRIEANHMQFAFHDGAELWDSNFENNYNAEMPGKFLVRNGKCTYLGPTEIDLLAARLR